jgi:hypothetical protein
VATQLVALVALEACLCAFFGWQIAHAAEPAPAAAAPSPTAVASDAAAEFATAASATATSPLPNATGVANERAVVRRLWRSDDPIGVMLTGTARWSDGAVIADPAIWLQLAGKTRSASCAADGSFVAIGLTPGEWSATIRTEGAESKQTVTVGEDAEQRHDFVIERTFPIRVFGVTPDGKDLTKAAWEAKLALGQLQVVGQRDALPERLAPTDYGVAYAGDAKWHGEMNSKDGFLGTLHLVAPPPAHAALLLRHVVLQQQRIEPGQSELKFVVDVDAVKALVASVSLRVVDDATSAPLAGIRVGLSTSSAGGVGGPLTDADGRITLTTTAPGLLFLTMDAKDRESHWSTIRVEPGAKVDLGDIRLGTPQPLKGRLVGIDGNSGRVDVRWTELKWRHQPFAFASNRRTKVEASGEFTLWGTGRGPIAVQAFTRDGMVAMGVFDNPPAAPVELRLVRGVKCQVVRKLDPTKAYTVTFFDAENRPIQASKVGTQAYEQAILMPPGTWRFEMHDETERLVKSGTLEFGAEPVTLEIP